MRYLFLFALGAGAACGAVIDFNSVVNGSVNQNYAAPLTTQGFRFASGHFQIIDAPASCPFGGCAAFNGTQFLSVDAPQLGLPVAMTEAVGASFDVISIQASRLFVDGTTAALANFINADFLVLTGALNGGGSVSVNIPLPALPGFNTFSLPSTFVNLVSLTISGSVPGVTDNASWGVDNIDVHISSVPEPTTMLLSAAGLTLLFSLRKHRR